MATSRIKIGHETRFMIVVEWDPVVEIADPY